MERIGGETLVLLADLRERLEVFEAMRTIASLPGDFVAKVLGGTFLAIFLFNLY